MRRQTELSASAKGLAGVRLLQDRMCGLADAWPVACLSKSMMDPFILILVMYVLAVHFDIRMGGAMLLMTVLAFLAGTLLLDNACLLLDESHDRFLGIGRFVVSWILLSLFIDAVCSVSSLHGIFPDRFILAWLTICPAALLTGHFCFRLFFHYVASGQRAVLRVLVIGANASGQILANRIRNNARLGLEFVGYIEDRDFSRLDGVCRSEVIGDIPSLRHVIQAQQIRRIYISLPMAPHQRILEMLESLKDSTVSVYFVPDLTIFDLIQARLGHVSGLPVLGVCETPFIGLRGPIKRIEDIVLAALILMLIWPVLLLVAIGVKATSPGPVLFVQRRYGVDGQSIDVFKFRSMTVMEDGAEIRQAQKGDSRLTPIGAFLRRTSLDELPQFFNVLLGSMSIVGPRPHANAHNELYRPLVRGYMIRHKVKPGITGWAQVNGMRGETSCIEQMQGRIDFDLEYIRHWSVWLDLKIVIRTVTLMFWDKNAY
jgi:putative colanic acid biosynthesis UDP-glucose lipid carrier transferase